jgi:glycosyltransferase involved in cell wall biosynthesis
LNLAKKFPEIEFRFVGKASAEVENYAKEQGICNAVFTGPTDRDGVKRELAAADIFLFLTYFPGEGFSNALAEAMAAGLPCIVSDWAANRDMIGEDGGEVVPVHGVETAFEALKKMLPAEVRKAQSLANLRKVREEYIESVVIDCYVDCYESLL